MNILIYFGPQLNPQRGGTERVACMIADYLLSAGHDVCYMASTPVEDKLSRKSVFLPDGKDAPTATNIAFVINYIKENKIDMILNEGASNEAVYIFSHEHIPATVKIISHLHFSVLDDIKNFYYTLNYPLKGVPLAQACINILKWIKAPYNKWNALRNKRQRYHYMYENSDTVVVLTDKQKASMESLLRINPSKKVVAVQNPNLVNVSETNFCKKENLIIFVGRLDYSSKRADRVLAVWSLIQNELKNWRIVIVGSGDDELRLKKMSQDWALQRIEFAGQADSAPYYSSAKILLLTSNYEGTPMVITEAMAAGGVPIVMNAFKDADLNIKNGYNGLLTSPFDTKEMAKRVLQLAKNESNLRRMSENAKQTIDGIDNSNRLKIWSEWANGN
jgi:glycosyltransferase involved in cell wall biosynthesis